MATFPDVTLAAPYIAQTEYKSDFVDVLQIADDVINKRLKAFCQLGTNPSFKYWIDVLNPDNYTVDWTNEMVESAIKNYFINA